MKISILGGGGTRTPLLVKGFLTMEEKLGLEEISLMDIDEERLLLIKKVLDEISRETGEKVRLTYTLDIKASIDNASFVVCAIRVGGEKLRILDEKIPLSFNVLGQETMGPGGFAMAVRTIPVVLKIADQLNEVNPEAWLINFTNPSGIITQSLVSHSPLKKVVGICDAPSYLQKVIAYFMNKKEEDIFLDYFGLNHFGWIKGVYVDGKDLLPSILNLITKTPDFEKITRFPPDLLTLIKMLPNPYLYYYYFKNEATKNLIMAEKTRGEIIKEMNDELFSSLKESKIPLLTYNNYISMRESSPITMAEFFNENMSFAEGEGYVDVALKVIEGLSGSENKSVIINTKNLTASPGFNEDDVVEVPSIIRNGFVRPISTGNIPSECLNILKQLKTYEHLLIEGVTTSSYNTLLYALTLNLWIPSYNLARKILDSFIEEEKDYFPDLTK